jgi:hypothetical protein
MDSDAARELLSKVASGAISPEAALARIQTAPYDDLGFARVDHHRAIRDGLPEVVLALGKTPAQVAEIARRVFDAAGRVLVTRVDQHQGQALTIELPHIHWDAGSRLAWCDPCPRPRCGNVAVVTAGTSDIPVAEEAAITAEMMGADVHRFYDVGVAGLHRLANDIDALRQANALVVVAGMEGALPSVIGGLVQNPVIAVPTSVGYGASFGGIAALLGIDNGFGAGFTAATINRLAIESVRQEAGK